MIRGLRAGLAGRARHASLLLVAGAMLGACDSNQVGGTGASPSPAPSMQAVIVSGGFATADNNDPCSGALACSVVGPNQRLGIFITDPSGGVISDATVVAQVFTVSTSSGSQAQSLGPVQQATYHGAGIESPDPQINRGVYSIYQTFQNPGQYRVSVKATRGTTSATTDISLLVLAADPGIAVGSPAPRSRNPTRDQVSDIFTIDTGTPPDDMHYISIADAIAAHRPVAIYMGTPGFCQSRTCAPEQNAVKAVEATYRPKGVDFVHIETYDGGRPNKPDPSQATRSPTFVDWKLFNEPAVMLVDKTGNVAYKFFGATGGDEIAAALDKLLS